MRKSWRLQGIFKSYIIIHKTDLHPDEETEKGLAFLSNEIDRWLSDPFSRRDLLDMYSSISGNNIFGIIKIPFHDLRKRLKPRLEMAFHREEFVALAVVPRRAFLSDAAGESAAIITTSRVLRPSSLKTSWVEIELVDEEGNPVGGEKYQVILTDGSKREGVLDTNGYARVDGFTRGTCKISFPNLDTAAWERV